MGQRRVDQLSHYKSINTQKSFERLMDLNRRHHYPFIALMEPFQDSMEIDHYKRKLGFSHATVNMPRKIWIFWREEWIGRIELDSIQ
ncbi:hypothetical protein H5410_030417 [Solanum commersonii]|uniref:Uncharacterized protein n=1 Tax=Solanum commersonii TaxID=4109 RepID=A0A9J5YGT7_SOLCO|nr:hypothetical protein H5410_030417 [Solanum commersonii]